MHKLLFEASVKDSSSLKKELLSDSSCWNFVRNASESITNAFKTGGKLLIAGNGGSAADAQHFAAELTGRFKRERRALPALALTTDTSAITAIGNDYTFDDIFSRQIDALCTANDILFVISTSGHSSNIVNALLEAGKKGAKCMALLGKDGGQCKELASLNYIVRSNESARIQEVHIMLEHIICDIVEQSFTKNGE